MTDRDVDVTTGERDKCYTHRLFHWISVTLGILPSFTFPMPSFSLKNQEVGGGLATDRDIDITTGERDKCDTDRLFYGVLPNFTFPMPFFILENQELGGALATDRDVDVKAGERDN